MEKDKDSINKWKLKTINKLWFLNVNGKLTHLNMLNDPSTVYLEENLIFADEVIYQLTEERNGDVIVTKVKNINQKEQKENLFDTNDDIVIDQTDDYEENASQCGDEPAEENSVQNDSRLKQNIEENEKINSVTGIYFLFIIIVQTNKKLKTWILPYYSNGKIIFTRIL